VIAIDIGADEVLRAQDDEVSTPPWWRMVLEHFGPPRRPGLANILLRAGMVNAEATSAERRKLVSLLLTPPLRGIGLLDWQDYELAIEKGYQYALREIGGQKDALTEDTPLFVSG
jgi:NTE family protein